MMDDYSSNIEIPQPCDMAVEWMIGRLNQAGLSARRTFDLHQAMQANPGCDCPHHATEQCDCQMVVLVVSGSAGLPVTLVAHGHENQTWFSMVDNPQQRVDPHIGRIIRHCFHATAPIRLNLGNSQDNSTVR